MSGAAAGASRRRILGVESSFSGRAWATRLDAAQEAQALAIAQLGGLDDILARVLAARGVRPDAAAGYLEPSLRDLMPDPACLVGMDGAVDRLAAAVEAGACVAVFGDYDVDGAAAAALLAGYLEHCGCRALVHIPDRIFEGYGPNEDAVRDLHRRGAALLVTVDCGTTSHAAIAAAGGLGLDPIVLDHHQAPERLPAATIVNPNRLDDLSGLGQLCAAGVVFMTLVALQRSLRRRGFFNRCPEPDLLATLDLVALATVADVAPLTGLNRAFVNKGLQVMRSRSRPGLRALFDVSGAVGPATVHQLGFLVAPRINAGGRIGDASLGAKLLMLRDEAQADALALQLDQLNRERQALELATLADAEAEALHQVGLRDDGAAVIVVGGDWHPGIVGIIAGRLRETFGRPAFAVALRPDGSGTGSGRSLPGVDLGRAVRAAVEANVISKGGGHAMAAGVTLRPDGFVAFRTHIEGELGAATASARAASDQPIDATLAGASAMTLPLVTALERAGPFGSQSPEPVFALPAQRLVDVSPVGNGHLRLRALGGDGGSLDAMAFRAADAALGRALVAARGERVHLAGTLMLDRWGGRERVRLRLLDAARA